MAGKAVVAPKPGRRSRVWWAAGALGLVLIIFGLLVWRTPVLELDIEGAGTRLLRLGDEPQFALAWEGLNSEGERTVAIVLLEAIDGRLSVISSTGDEEPEPFVTVGNGHVRFRVRSSANPVLIYGGGQLLLSSWCPEGSDLLIRYRLVPVVRLWGRG